MAHLATLGFACSPFASLFCEANKTARMQKRAASERTQCAFYARTRRVTPEGLHPKGYARSLLFKSARLASRKLTRNAVWRVC